MLLSIGFVALVGLSLGSFLNVCAYRIPRGISIIAPGSACPHCHRPLRWFEMIPLASFALQRGKCTTCHLKISLRYPLYEIFAAASSLSLLLKFEGSGEFVVASVFVLAMSLVVLIDWEFFVIPNEVLIAVFLIGAFLLTLLKPGELPESLLGAAISLAVMFGTRLLGNWAFKRESLGMGDVKLSAVLGLFLGVHLFLLAFWLAALLGSMYGLVRPKKFSRRCHTIRLYARRSRQRYSRFQNPHRNCS